MKWVAALAAIIIAITLSPAYAQLPTDPPEVTVPDVTLPIPTEEEPELPPPATTVEIPHISIVPVAPQEPTEEPEQPQQNTDSPGTSEDQKPYPIKRIEVNSLDFDADREISAKAVYSLCGLVVGFVLGLLFKCYRVGRNDKE